MRLTTREISNRRAWQFGRVNDRYGSAWPRDLNYLYWPLASMGSHSWTTKATNDMCRKLFKFENVAL